jgi:transcriptional regulator with XRE-family HTH domain
MPPNKLDNYLRTNRKKLGLTQREVAFLLGCHSRAKVSHYERSGRIPTLNVILAYEVIFQKPARELFAGLYDRAERKTMRNLRLLLSRLKRRRDSSALALKIANLRAVVESGSNDLQYEAIPES